MTQKLNVRDFLTNEGYKLEEVVGEGSYAKVWKATYKSSILAVKIINTRSPPTPPEFSRKFLPREIRILSEIKHQNIVKAAKIYKLHDKVLIIMEYCSGGDLLEYIKNNGALNESTAKRFFQDMLTACSYLHQHGICHRDLKCENLLLTETMRIKLIDFGFSRNFDENRDSLSRTFCGSTSYAAPEVIRGESYNPFLYDIWSMGCVLYIMLSGSMPFDDADVKKMLKMQMQKQVRFSSKANLKIEARHLVMSLLEPDVRRRIRILTIFEHPWLTPKGERPRGSSMDVTKNKSQMSSMPVIANVATHSRN